MAGPLMSGGRAPRLLARVTKARQRRNSPAAACGWGGRCPLHFFKRANGGVAVEGAGLVVIARLKELDTVLKDFVDQPINLIDPS
jgi:hypothetical protein